MNCQGSCFVRLLVLWLYGEELNSHKSCDVTLLSGCRAGDWELYQNDAPLSLFIQFLLQYLFNSTSLILKCVVLDRQYFYDNMRFVVWAINTEFINHISLPYWKRVISYLHFTTGGTKMSVTLICFTISMLETCCLTTLKGRTGICQVYNPIT